MAEASEGPTTGEEPGRAERAGGEVGVEVYRRCPASDAVQLCVSNSNQVERHVRMHTNMVRRPFPAEKWQD